MNDRADNTEKADHVNGQVSKIGRLDTVLDRVRTLLPLPHEMLQQAETEEKDRLAIIIETTAVGRPIIDLASRLSSRDLRYIFPLLAETAETGRLPAHFHEKLYLIIRERASYSLYRYGWSVFQQDFPSLPVGRGLAVLCGILEIREKSGQLQERAGKQARGRLLPPALISYLAAPDSRRFVDHLLHALNRRQVSLDQFFKQYTIAADQPLGSALIGQCFLKGQAALYVESHRLFDLALPQVPAALQQEMVSRLLAVSLDPVTKTQYLQVIYRHFGDPGGGHPIWHQLRRKDVLAYHSWVIAATIGRHCQGRKAKIHFYQRYAALVQHVEAWDQDTLIMSFGAFLIVDDRRMPLFALYYDQDTLGTHQSGDNAPGGTAVPHRHVEDAVRRGSTRGPVGLVFDEKGLRISASFLDFCLYQNNIASRNDLKRLPPL